MGWTKNGGWAGLSDEWIRAGLRVDGLKIGLKRVKVVAMDEYMLWLSVGLAEFGITGFVLS